MSESEVDRGDAFPFTPAEDARSVKGAESPPRGARRVVPPADRWFAVPDAALDAPVSDGAYRLYCVLLALGGRDGVAYPGQTWLGGRLRCTDREVRRRLEELRAAGLIDCHHRGQGRSDLYVLRSRPALAADAPTVPPRPPSPDRPVHSRPDRPVHSRPDRPVRLDRSKEIDQGRHTPPPPDPPPPPAEPAGVCALLAQAGVPRPKARRLVAKHGEAECQRQLDALPRRRADDRVATLIAAIEGHWLPPDANVTLRLPNERAAAPLPPPPDLGPLPGPESDAARDAARAALVARGAVALAPRLANIHDKAATIGWSTRRYRPDDDPAHPPAGAPTSAQP